MLRQIFFALLMLFCVTACGEGEVVKPVLSYQANFDPSDVDQIESFIKSVAKRWDLRVYEKDRKQMSVLTQGEDAFFIALYLNGNSILDISNVGMGKVLTMGVFDYDEMPLEKLHALAHEITAGLSQKFGIEFKQQSKQSGTDPS
jgi:hypothetical protein